MKINFSLELFGYRLVFEQKNLFSLNKVLNIGPLLDCNYAVGGFVENEVVCSEPTKTPKYKRTAVVIPIKDGKVLLTKRLDTKTYPFFYAVPGGKNFENEFFNVCGQRELKEETGIYIKDLERFELLEITNEEPTSEEQAVFLLCLRPGEKPSDENPEPLKHEDWKFYKLEDAVKLKLIPLLYKYLNQLIEEKKNVNIPPF